MNNAQFYVDSWKEASAHAQILSTLLRRSDADADTFNALHHGMWLLKNKEHALVDKATAAGVLLCLHMEAV